MTIRKRIETLIKKNLNQTKKDCDYKIAHFPTGWTSVNINECSKHLADEINKKVLQLK